MCKNLGRIPSTKTKQKRSRVLWDRERWCGPRFIKLRSILLVFDEYTLVKYLESPHRIAVCADVSVRVFYGIVICGT